MIDTESHIQTQTSTATLLVPANLNYSAAVRDFALASLKNVGGFDSTWAYRLQLVVDEIFMNAVRYGSAPESDVQVSFDFAPHRVIVSVDDRGDGAMRLSPRELEEHVTAARHQHEAQRRRGEKNFALSGRGLSQLVSSWADSLSFADSPTGGIRVTISKAL